MSKSLKSIRDTYERNTTIQRRVQEAKGGLGYLAACKAAGVKPTIKKQEVK
jgi:hypothetical protein